MHGAQAAQRLLAEDADPGLRFYVVWMPMIPTDDEAAARRAAKLFHDGRVRQFYDPQRLAGLAYMTDVFPHCLAEALASLPADHPLRPDIEGWAAGPSGTRPMWDAALVYDPDMEWRERVPAPTRWLKQVGFWGGKPGRSPTGTFWKNACSEPPIDSDWLVELRETVGSLPCGKPTPSR